MPIRNWPVGGGRPCGLNRRRLGAEGTHRPRFSSCGRRGGRQCVSVNALALQLLLLAYIYRA